MISLHEIKSVSVKDISRKNISFEDFDFSEYSKGGQKRFTIQGKKMFPESQEIGLGMLRTGASKALRLSEVCITLFENNIPVSRIEAKKAVLNKTPDRNNAIGAMTSRIDFYGDVSVSTKDRRTLVCTSLVLDNENNQISASGNCALRYEGKVVKADYINADIKLCDFSLRNDAGKRLKSLAKIFKTI